MKLSSIILKPIVTEKSYDAVAANVYTFKVNMKATKYSIEKEIKRMYGVDAVSVNTSVTAGKKRRIIGTRMTVKTPKWKKASVKIREGQKIELFPKE
jgi:large subunit ribosomal protein L23